MSKFFETSNGKLVIKDSKGHICLGLQSECNNIPKNVLQNYRIVLAGSASLYAAGLEVTMDKNGTISATTAGQRIMTYYPRRGVVVAGDGTLETALGGDMSNEDVLSGSVFFIGNSVHEFIGTSYLLQQELRMSSAQTFYRAVYMPMNLPGVLFVSRSKDSQTLFFPDDRNIPIIVGHVTPGFINANLGVDVLVGGSMVYNNVKHVEKYSCLNNNLVPFSNANKEVVMYTYLHGLHCGAYGDEHDRDVHKFESTVCYPTDRYKSQMKSIFVKQSIAVGGVGITNDLFTNYKSFKVDVEQCKEAKLNSIPSELTFEFYTDEDCEEGVYRVTLSLKGLCGDNTQILCTSYPE